MDSAAACPICGTTAPALSEDGVCLVCAGLLRWFRSYFADVRGLDPRTITPATRFVEDLGADCLDYVDWVLAAEVAFDVRVPDRDAQRTRTVGAFLAWLRGAGAVWPDACDVRIEKKWWGSREWTIVDSSDDSSSGGGRDG